MVGGAGRTYFGEHGGCLRAVAEGVGFEVLEALEDEGRGDFEVRDHLFVLLLQLVDLISELGDCLVFFEQHELVVLFFLLVDVERRLVVRG